MFGLCSFGSSHSYAVIIIDFLNSNGSPFFGNVVKTCFGSTFRHTYNGFLSKTVGSPCNTASVISVSCGKESSLPEFFSQCFRRKNCIWKFTDILADFFGYVTSHCVGTTENLECIQAETVGLIFAMDTFYTKIGCQSGEILKRSNGVLWETFVKFIGFFHVFFRH